LFILINILKLVLVPLTDFRSFTVKFSVKMVSQQIMTAIAESS